VFATIDREFHGGPSTLAGAADLAAWEIISLDDQLAAIRALGAKTIPCFDDMPFTLSA